MPIEISIDQVRSLDDAVLSQLRQHKADYYGGVTLFVGQPWAKGGQNYDTVLAISNKLDLKLGDSVEEISAEFSPPFKAVEEMEYRISRNILPRINTLSSLTKHGGGYTTGWDNNGFGLVFSANPVAVEAIMSSQAKARTGFYTDAETQVSRLRNAIHFIKQVDFGRGQPVDIRLLELAAECIEPCGIKSEPLDMAIRYFLPDRDRAKQLVHGPSCVGSNRGALNDLIDQLNALEGHSSKTNHLDTDSISETSSTYVAYAGTIYELVQDADEEPIGMIREAYKLPKKMKGVSKCKARDIDETLPRSQQIWCVYDKKGRLKKRCKSELEARRHKVYLIRMYWTKGRGKNSPARPKNTFRKPVKRR